MDLKKLILDHYGILADSLTLLEGFEDKTFKLESGGETWIFKQYSRGTNTEAFLHIENAVLEQLTSLSFQFPELIRTKANDPQLVLDDHVYRLLTFLDGDLLGEVEQTQMILQSFGSMLGAMDASLQDLYEPELAGKQTEWDLQFFSMNLKFLPAIEDASNRSLVEYYFMQFDEMVVPMAHLLRKGIIHCDANDWNVITDGQVVNGIFDFGDMTYSWVINELAIGITYAMMNKEEPLAAACEVIKGYHKELPLQEVELEVLYYLVGARLCTSVCNSAYGKKTKPDSDYVVISEKAAWDLLHKWISISPIKACRQFMKTAGFSLSDTDHREQLLKKRDDYLSKSLSLSYSRPIHMDRAAFQYMFDTRGNTFLDAYNNIMLVGHCHPKVVSDGQKQLARMNTNTRYLYDIIYEYAEKLLSKFPEPLNKVFFVNSGSEASDLALRMARHHTSRNRILALEQGYHGNTTAGIEASHYKYSKLPLSGRFLSTIETPVPKVFGSGLSDDGSCGSYYATLARNSMEPYLNNIAAFIAEPVMGCAGQVPLARNYLKEVYQSIRDQGGVCISDEVQVGFGRLGDHFWGFQYHQVIPDIVVLGKPMGNGHPIGAVVVSEEIAASFEEGPEFFSSFGGNPVSCAIGNAVLDVIEAEELQMKAKAVGSHLKEGLSDLQNHYPALADIRGYGMFLGIELVDKKGYPLTDLASTLKNDLRTRYILVGTDGPAENVIKIKPPLSFNLENANTLLYEFDQILSARL